jgi:DNA polymerase V
LANSAGNTIRLLSRSSQGHSSDRSHRNPLELYAWLVRNTERLIEELEYHGVTAGRLHLWLGYKDAPHGVGVASPEVPTDRFDLLLDAGRFALRQAYRLGAAAERMHLIAQPLIPRALAARSLFVPPGGRTEALAALKR